jgi:tetratricopeptide (TPR) repeat protein
MAVKLPQSAYLKSAKIALADTKSPRLDEAMMLLDSAVFYYGAIPEALFLRGNIYAEMAAKNPNLQKKIEFFKLMSDNYDSLTAACNNPEIKKDLKKDCRRMSDLCDSVRVKYWSEYYNEGVKGIEKIDKELSPKVKDAADQASADAAGQELNNFADSAKYFFMVASTVDNKDYRAYEGVGLIYDRLKNLDSSLVWLVKSMEHAQDTTSHLILNIAYAYIQKNEYQKAIEYFGKYLKLVPNDANNIFNVAICYSNLQEFDSSLHYDKLTMAVDSTIPGPYIDAGQNYLLRSQKVSDSIKFYAQQNKTEEAKHFTKMRDAILDTSASYFEVASRLDPSNVMVLEQYAVAKLVAGHYAEAGEIYKKLTEVEPDRGNNWLSLGDIYVQQQKLKEAVPAYEKATELNPGDGEVWKVLKDLYHNLNMPEKEKIADEKLNELGKM